MPEEPNRERSNVRKIFFTLYLPYFQFNIFLVHNFDILFFCSPFSHWLLWFCSTPPPKPAPKPSPAPPASHNHSDQCASAAGLFTGRAPETKALSPVVQHHSQRLFQEMRLCSLIPPVYDQSMPKPSWRQRVHFIFSLYFTVCECNIKLCFCASYVFLYMSVFVACWRSVPLFCKGHDKSVKKLTVHFVGVLKILLTKAAETSPLCLINSSWKFFVF